MAPKPKLVKLKVSLSNTTINAFFKASNAPVDPQQVEKVTVTVELHADHSAADGNRAVTSEVNRTAISPIMTVAAVPPRPPAGKVGSHKTPRRAQIDSWLKACPRVSTTSG